MKKILLFGLILCIMSSVNAIYHGSGNFLYYDENYIGSEYYNYPIQLDSESVQYCTIEPINERYICLTSSTNIKSCYYNEDNLYCSSFTVSDAYSTFITANTNHIVISDNSVYTTGSYIKVYSTSNGVYVGKYTTPPNYTVSSCIMNEYYLVCTINNLNTNNSKLLLFEEESLVYSTISYDDIIEIKNNGYGESYVKSRSDFNNYFYLLSSSDIAYDLLNSSIYYIDSSILELVSTDYFYVSDGLAYYYELWNPYNDDMNDYIITDGEKLYSFIDGEYDNMYIYYDSGGCSFRDGDDLYLYSTAYDKTTKYDMPDFTNISQNSILEEYSLEELPYSITGCFESWDEDYIYMWINNELVNFSNGVSVMDLDLFLDKVDYIEYLESDVYLIYDELDGLYVFEFDYQTPTSTTEPTSTTTTEPTTTTTETTTSTSLAGTTTTYANGEYSSKDRIVNLDLEKEMAGEYTFINESQFGDSNVQDDLKTGILYMAEFAIIIILLICLYCFDKVM